MNDDRIFCGSGKVFTYKGNQQGFEIKFTIDQLRDAIKAAEERGWIREYNSKNGKQKEVKLVGYERKEPTPYETHYLQLAEPYRKEESTETASATQSAYSVASQIEDDNDGLPF